VLPYQLKIHTAQGGGLEARPNYGRSKETGRASGATGYLLTEEIVGFVFASGPKGREVMRKDC